VLTQNKPFNKITIDDPVEKEDSMCMKIGAVISNPPYQMDDGGNGRSAKPIFNEYVGVGKTAAKKYSSLIIPAKWYSGGKGLDDFRGEMLTDRQIEHLVDYADSYSCFGDSADVAGGVCYFLRNETYDGLCNCESRGIDGKSQIAMRDLSERKVFVRSDKASAIIRKIEAVTAEYMSSVVSSRKPFGLATNVKLEEKGDVSVRYNGGWAKYNLLDVSIGRELVDQWNVMMSCLSAEHAGQPDKNGQYRILSTLDLLAPGEICTETYILAGSFRSKAKAKNLLAYLKTRFVRFLVGQIAVTQHVTKNSFAFVPMQDFNEPWTDEKLYKKYGITKEEQAFIESMIKPMV